MEPVTRHKLVWLREAGWQVLLSASRPRDEALLAERWARAQWPAICRRRDADAVDGEVCLGIPAPPDPASGRKQRFGFRLPAEAVARVAAPPRLQEITDSLPQQWRQAVQDLCSQADGMTLRAYGSAAFAHLTGLPYLTPQSDIDLLWQPASPSELTRGLDLLAGFAGRLPLDGEIQFPGGRAVAWKEWRLAAGDRRNRVLVKDDGQVRLVSVDALLSSLEAA